MTANIKKRSYNLKIKGIIFVNRLKFRSICFIINPSKYLCTSMSGKMLYFILK